MPEQSRATVETYHQAVQLSFEENDLLEQLEVVREKRRALEERLKAALGSGGRRAQIKSPPALKGLPKLKRGTRVRAARAKSPRKSPSSEFGAKLGAFLRQHNGTPVTLATMREQAWAPKDGQLLSNQLYRLKLRGEAKRVASGSWAAL